MEMNQALEKLVNQQDLSTAEMKSVMQKIMTGQATNAQIGGFLVALRMKSESIDEITGAVEVMRSLSTPVSVSGDYLVDTCGTGGDGADLFNVSTAAAFVVAAAHKGLTHLSPLVMTGFLGGFTTFSTFAYENHVFLKSGDFMTFAIYTITSFALGFLAVFFGMYLAK